MRIKLLTKHHLEFLSLKGGCTGSSAYPLVKMPLLESVCHGSLMIKTVLTRVHISMALANVDNVNGVTHPGIISLKKENKSK